MKNEEFAKTRVDVLLEKGAEELLPEELYTMLYGSGLWIEEKRDGTIIRAYSQDVSAFIDYLKKLDLKIKDIAIVQEQPVDYSELTRRYFRPIKIEDMTIIAPWNKKVKHNRHILIEPGMAFGTGRHESTRLMFKLMKDVNMKDRSVLDLGCGSGILSLYANHLGAKRIVAVDNDTDAVESAKKNVDLNCVNNLELICADITKIKGLFDIILANLDIKTFMCHASHIKKLLPIGGIIIVSGVLVKNTKNVAMLFHPLSLLRSVKKNSWCGLVFENSF